MRPILSHLSLLFLLIFANGWTFGQDKVRVDGKAQFREGLYLTAADAQRNSPVAMNDLKIDYRLSEDGNQLLVAFAMLPNRQPVQTEKVWAFGVGGSLYVGCLKDLSDAHSVVFIKLHPVGNICYAYYEMYETRTVSMPVFNPVTEETLYKGTIKNKEKKRVKYMFRFGTGESAEFTLDNFKTWIADDKMLLKSINNLAPQEAEDKLFKTLLIYNDRHPVYLE